MKRVILFILLSISLFCFAEETVKYHYFYSTASMPKLVEWDVKPDTLNDIYIKETIDELGRVKELRFIHGIKLVQFTVFQPSIITFEYSNNQIISTMFYADGRKMSSVVPWKIIYTTKNNEIVSVLEFSDYTPFYTIEIEGISDEQKEEFREKAELEKNGVESTIDFIWGYEYSMAKFSGMNFVSKEFYNGNHHFTYSEEARKSKYAFMNSLIEK